MATIEERQARLQEDTETKQSSGFLQEINVGLARMLGAPVDLANFVISPVTSRLGLYSDKPVGGGASIQGLFKDIGAAPAPGEEGQTFEARALQEVGATAIPFLGLLGKGRGLLEAGKKAETLIQKSALKTAQKPIKSAIQEAAAATGAAGGGILLQDAFNTDEPWVRAIGELGGGTLTSLVTGLPTVRAVKGGIKAVKSKVSGKGAEARAGRRIGAVAEDIEIAQRKLDRPDEFGAPAGAATGDEGILRLTKAVAEENPGIARKLKEQFAVASKKARDAVIVGGDPDAPRAYLDSRLNQASAAAHERIITLKGTLTDRAASKIVREEIEKALTEARAGEAAVWGKISKDARASLNTTRDSLVNELADRTVSDDPADIPAFIYELLGRSDKSGKHMPGKLTKGPITVKEADGLRKRLSAEIRSERGKEVPSRNKLRILQEIHSSVLDDIDLTAAGDDVRNAIDYSRDLNRKFSQGAVGDLMGYEKAGGRSFSAEETMERIIKGKGESQARAFRELLEASPAAREPAVDYLKASFMEQAVDPNTGIVRPADANRFMKRNGGLLKELPELRGQINEAMTSQRSVDEILGAGIAREGSAVQKQRSAVSLYLDSTPGEEFNAVFKSRAPAKTMKGLAAQVARDKTGNATKGLKSALGRYLLKKSTTNSEDVIGANIISGKRFFRQINENIDAISQVLSKDEIARLKRIGEEFASAEKFMSISPAHGGVISDPTSRIIDFVTGTALARGGAKLGAGTSGASLRTASIATKEGKKILSGLTNDKAREVIIGAVMDRQLMQDLLTDISKVPPAQAEKIFGRVRAWMAAASTSGMAPESEPLRITTDEDKDDLEKRMRSLEEALGEE